MVLLNLKCDDANLGKSVGLKMESVWLLVVQYVYYKKKLQLYNRLILKNEMIVMNSEVEDD